MIMGGIWPTYNSTVYLKPHQTVLMPDSNFHHETLSATENKSSRE